MPVLRWVGAPAGDPARSAAGPLSLRCFGCAASNQPEVCTVVGSSCNLRDLCPALGLSAADWPRLDPLASARRSLTHGEMLVRTGDALQSPHVARTHFFTIWAWAEDSRDQVTDFRMGEGGLSPLPIPASAVPSHLPSHPCEGGLESELRHRRMGGHLGLHALSLTMGTHPGDSRWPATNTFRSTRRRWT